MLKKLIDTILLLCSWVTIDGPSFIGDIHMRYGNDQINTSLGLLRAFSVQHRAYTVLEIV